MYLSISTSYISVSISNHLYIFLYPPAIYQFQYPTIHISFYIQPALYLSICPYPSFYLYFCSYLHATIYPSIYIYIYLSIYLSIYLPTYRNRIHVDEALYSEVYSLEILKTKYLDKNILFLFLFFNVQS